LKGFRKISAYGAVAGLNKKATLLTRGAISLRSSSHLPASEPSNALKPVFVQQLHSLSYNCNIKRIYACAVATRSIKAGAEAKLHRVNADIKDDRNRRGRRLSSERRRGGGRDYQGHPAANEIGRDCAAIFDRVILVFDVPGFPQALPDGAHTASVGFRRPRGKESDHGQSSLLCARLAAMLLPNLQC
jgi:hypothetical protein